MKLPTALRAEFPRAVALIVLVLSLSACMRFTVSESAFIRPTPEPKDATPVLTRLAEVGQPGQLLSIRADDGVKLHAVWVQRDPALPTLLYFGGNMSLASKNTVALLRETEGMAVNLLVVDHRGSGFSEGTPTMHRLYHDAINVYDHATGELGIPAERIVVHGFSLGSFLAGYVALHRPVVGLVLEGSATTAEEWASELTPWWGKPFVRADIDEHLQGRGNLWVVKRQPAPLLIVVGSKDRQTTAALSEHLYQAAREAGRQAELLVVPGAGHGNALANSEARQRYRRWFSALFDTDTGQAASP